MALRRRSRRGRAPAIFRVPGGPVPMGRYLGRRRLRLLVAAVVASLAAVLFVGLDRRGGEVARGGDWDRYDGKSFRVTRVVDGDTLDVDVPDGKRATTRIRLWGIDTPELARADRKQPEEPLASEAAALARELCLEQEVVLRLDPHDTRDRYDRLLATIELPDGTLLNERLLLAGLARYEERYAHQWMERFSQAEQQARDRRVGLWAEAGSRGTSSGRGVRRE